MTKKLSIIFASLLLAVSCESEMANTVVTQEKNIDTYIKNSLSEYEIVRTEISNRVILREGTGATISKGDRIKMYYIGYTLGSSGPSKEFTNDSTEVIVGTGKLIKGLDDGIVGMREGEEAAILFTTKYAYGKEAVGIVPEQTALLFQVYVEQIVPHISIE